MTVATKEPPKKPEAKKEPEKGLGPGMAARAQAQVHKLNTMKQLTLQLTQARRDKAAAATRFAEEIKTLESNLHHLAVQPDDQYEFEFSANFPKPAKQKEKPKRGAADRK